jgi:hypothetical protein
MRVKPAASLVTGVVILLAGCGNSPVGPANFTVYSEGGQAQTLFDAPPVGPSVADALYWEDRLVTAEGKDAGWYFGTATIAAVPAPRPSASSEGEIRTVEITFDLPDGTILAIGRQINTTTFAPLGTDKEVGLPSNDSQERAIIGGTGAYRGARGVDVVTRRDDGSYSHEFRFGY